MSEERNQINYCPATIEDWSALYSAGRTRWQLENVHPMLLKCATRLGLSSPKRVFVPLCGKSVDMKWLTDNGHTVVGLEGAEIAVAQFFEENEIPYYIEEKEFGKIYKAEHGLLEIFVCDINCIVPEVLGKFDVIWDRGSFFVVSSKFESNYVKLMKNLFGPDFRYLLMTIQFDDTQGFQEPPRNVTPDRVLELFGDTCKQELLQTNDISERFSAVTKVNIPCTESFLFLSPI